MNLMFLLGIAGAALLVILLADPFAAAGVSLQLSFAATLGLVCFSQRLSGFFRFLAKVGDNGMKMQIVKIGFGDRQ